MKEMSTKAKRSKLVEAVKILAEKHGAIIEIDPRLRDIYVCLSLAPYHVSMDFDGSSRVGAFMGHWFTDEHATFPTNVGITCGGSINTFHYGKATTCEDTFEAFLSRLDAGLAVCRERETTESNRSTITKT